MGRFVLVLYTLGMMHDTDSIQTAIAQKRRAIETAEQAIAELRRQIEQLQQVAQYLQPTRYEQFMQSNAVKDVAKSPDVESRNQRGGVQQAILNALESIGEGTLDQIMESVNLQLPSSTTKDSVRSTLMRLKKSGRVQNIRHGVYALPKGETPSVAPEGVSSVNQAAKGGTESDGLI